MRYVFNEDVFSTIRNGTPCKLQCVIMIASTPANFKLGNVSQSIPCWVSISMFLEALNPNLSLFFDYRDVYSIGRGAESNLTVSYPHLTILVLKNLLLYVIMISNTPASLKICNLSRITSYRVSIF